MSSSISTPNNSQYLTDILRQLEFRIQHEGVSRLIVARPSLRELKRYPLPSGVKVTAQKLHGPRKAVRGRRHYGQFKRLLASWPNDKLNENPHPILVCVVSGQVDLRIADYVLHCSVGDWLMFPAGVPKEDGSEPHLHGERAGKQGDVLWISSNGACADGLECWICRSREEEHFKVPNTIGRVHFPLLVQLCNGFYDEAQNDRRPDVEAYLLNGIILLLRSEIEAGRGQHAKFFLPTTAHDSKEPIEEAQVYMADNLHRHLTIESVASHVAVSPTTLIRHFRQHTSQSFTEHLTDKRMEMACHILRTTDYPVKQLSASVGLGDSQLRKLFQKRLHCTPTQYRELSRKNNQTT